MLRISSILLLSFFAQTSCNNEAKTTENTGTGDTIVSLQADTTPVTKPGSDRDEKGCITSAGYRWSVVMNNCIRIFESGIKMLPKDPSLDQTTAAYIVFSKDRVRVEIFLPTQEKAVIIRRTEGTGEPTQWTSGPLDLSLTEGMYLLKDEGKILYQGSAVK